MKGVSAHGNAEMALMGAADTDDDRGGTPYPRAFDLLVQVYEGGYDDALHTITWADSGARPGLCARPLRAERAAADLRLVDGRDDTASAPPCQAGIEMSGGRAE